MAAAPKMKPGEKKLSIPSEELDKIVARAVKAMGDEAREKLKHPPEKVSESDDGIFFPPADMGEDLPD